MRIAGVQRCSFVDWPGLISAVIFAPGCNLDCYFCHNHRLLGDCAPDTIIPVDRMLTWLDHRRGLVDGVVVTGGEPTLQDGLEDFVRAVRALDYPVKLDTNGTRPGVLLELLRKELVDYVAMDLKGPLERYDVIAGRPVDADAIDASIQIIMSMAPDYEFRTTVLPQFSEDDVLSMARRIRGAKRYILQQYRPAHRDAAGHATEPLPFRAVDRMAQLAAEYVTRCETRGVTQDIPVDAALAS
jgi:pyruvate formate lyase activating enzyme